MNRLLSASLVFSLVAAQTAAQDPAAAQSAAQNTFQVRSTSVPIDVTVLDSSGNPVLDLTAADFEVFENGRPQILDHFEAPRPNLAGTTLERAAENASATKSPSPDPTVQPRYFLILMGNIGHDYFHSIRDVADFVEQLGPRDRVALMAFRRVGRFSGDHQETAAAIRRYRKVNNQIRSVLEAFRKVRLFSSFSPSAGRLPTSVREKIRDFFRESGIASRELPEPAFQQFSVNLLNATVFDRLRLAESMDSLAQAFQGPDFPGLQSNLFVPPGFAVNRFDEARLRLLSDINPVVLGSVLDSSGLDSSQILTAIEHLSYLEGDKHLFFLNEKGLHEISETLEQISRFAASSRVRLHLFQTGGTDPSPLVAQNVRDPRAIFGASGSFRNLSRLRIGGGNLSDGLALSALKILAHETGGIASVRTWVSGSLERALQVSDSAYQLAYTPADTDWDGEFREIEVRVKREDCDLFYRKGYLGVPAPTEKERLDSLVLLRTVAAMKQPDHIEDIPLVLKVARRPDSEETSQFDVLLEARLPEGSLEPSNGTRSGHLAVAYFLIEDRQVVTIQDQLDLVLTETDYQSAVREGFNFTRHLAVPKAMADGVLKVVVFDPGQDLLGSIDMKLPM